MAEAENRFWVRVAPNPHKNQKGGWMLRDQKGFGPLLQLVAVEVWREYRDPASGKPYWVNKATKETTWRHPDKRPPKLPPPTTLHDEDALTVANPMLAAKRNASFAVGASGYLRRGSGSGLSTVGRRRLQEQQKRAQTPPRDSPTSPPEQAQSTTTGTGETHSGSSGGTRSSFWPQGSTPTGSDGGLSESESRDNNRSGCTSPTASSPSSFFASPTSFTAPGLLPPAPPSAVAEANARRAAQEEQQGKEGDEGAEEPRVIKPQARRASFSEQFTDSLAGAVGSLGEGFNAFTAQSSSRSDAANESSNSNDDNSSSSGVDLVSSLYTFSGLSGDGASSAPLTHGTEMGAKTVEVAGPDDLANQTPPLLPWQAVATPDGALYYHNTETGETSWELPGAREEMSPNTGVSL